MLKEEIWTKIEEDATKLLEAFKVLNMGKGSSTSDFVPSIAALKKQRTQKQELKPIPTHDEIQEAAKTVWDFLDAGTDSNVRMAMNLLASGGVFYAFQSADKMARSWVAYHSPKPNKVYFIEACQAIGPSNPCRVPLSVCVFV